MFMSGISKTIYLPLKTFEAVDSRASELKQSFNKTLTILLDEALVQFIQGSKCNVELVNLNNTPADNWWGEYPSYMHKRLTQFENYEDYLLDIQARKRENQRMKFENEDFDRKMKEIRNNCARCGREDSCHRDDNYKAYCLNLELFEYQE